MHEINKNDIRNLPNDSTKVIYACKENEKINNKIKKNKSKQKNILILSIFYAIFWILTVVFLCFHQWICAFISCVLMFPFLTLFEKKLFRKKDPIIGIMFVMLIFGPVFLIINFVQYKKITKRNGKLEEEKYYIND